MQGPDIGKSLALVECESDDLVEGGQIVKLESRISYIREWVSQP